jgi:hypothetical protein
MANAQKAPGVSHNAASREHSVSIHFLGSRFVSRVCEC